MPEGIPQSICILKDTLVSDFTDPPEPARMLLLNSIEMRFRKSGSTLSTGIYEDLLVNIFEIVPKFRVGVVVHKLICLAPRSNIHVSTSFFIYTNVLILYQILVYYSNKFILRIDYICKVDYVYIR